MEVKVNLKIEFQESFELPRDTYVEGALSVNEGFLNQIQRALSEAVATKKIIIRSWKAQQDGTVNINDAIEFEAIIPEDESIRIYL